MYELFNMLLQSLTGHLHSHRQADVWIAPTFVICKNSLLFFPPNLEHVDGVNPTNPSQVDKFYFISMNFLSSIHRIQSLEKKKAAKGQVKHSSGKPVLPVKLLTS